MQNYLDTIISQYAQSPILQQILDDFNSNIDPTVDINNFLTHVWNIDTATGFGLDIWGRIVGVGRSITIIAKLDNFGFAQGDWQGFSDSEHGVNQECFYTNGIFGSQVLILEDDIYRKLILIKAASNITACDAPSINAMLTTLFSDRGHAWVLDTGKMTMVYRFDFDLTDTDLAILLWSGRIHTPAGVQVFIDTVQGDTFGFSQAGLDGFSDTATGVSQGPFTLGFTPCT